MFKITETSKEMRDSFSEIRSKWIGAAVNCTPIDKECARRVVNKIYKKCRRPSPLLIKLPNPLFTNIAASILESKKKYEDIIGNKKSEEEITKKLLLLLEDIDISNYGIKIDKNVYVYWYFDWFAYAEVFAPYLPFCGAIDYESYKNCHIVLPTETICFISENPISIKRDERKRLHCENGPALSYSGGFDLYRWHGLRVPKEAILNRNSITREMILKEDNVEVRRSLVEMIGGERLVKLFQFECVSNDHVGKLWRGRLPTGEEIAMTELINSTPEPDGSFKTYWEGAHPKAKTCHDAVARAFGETVETYKPELET